MPRSGWLRMEGIGPSVYKRTAERPGKVDVETGITGVESLFQRDHAQGSGAALRRTVLCDGAMGTMIYSAGVYINVCYDELNLSQPDLVRNIHQEYLQAGAEIIETNTFGANRFRLERYGLVDKMRQINKAGVRIARESVRHMAEKHSTEAYVAGAIGPLGVRLEPVGRTSIDEAFEAFAEQVRALIEGGPGVGADLLVAETMQSMAEMEQAIRAARSEAPGLPLLVMVTVEEDGNCLDGTSAEDAARLMTQWGADAVGCNCSAGPATLLGVVERMRTATHLPLAVMPNAGIPRAMYSDDLHDLARVHGAGCAAIRACRRDLYRRLLRHYSGSHSRCARRAAGDGGDGRGHARRRLRGQEDDRLHARRRGAEAAGGAVARRREDRRGRVRHTGGDDSAQGAGLLEGA